MPQGRRKVPFSGKQKKQQLVAKRQSNKFFPNTRGYNADSDESANDGGSGAPAQSGGSLETVQKINYQATSSGVGGGNKGSHANRYALQFYKETEQQLREMREDARKPMVARTSAEMEVDSVFFDGYDFPVRPQWSYHLSKEQLNQNENRYFTEYVMKLERQHAEEHKMLSYFELNLETWRQLWRVLEISEIVLMIVDIRYPTLMFPPALFDHVTRVLRKDMILVLNKVDLAPPSVVLAWKSYFETKYVGITLVMFTSFPGYNLRNFCHKGYTRGLQIRYRRGFQRMAIEGAQQVFDACQRIVKSEVDLTSWAAKIADEERALEKRLEPTSDTETDDSNESFDDPKLRYDRVYSPEDTALDFVEHERFKDGVLTVGCVGLPNSGKSSVLNALMGRKVVSVSKTPGHTKHFQTIYLTPNVRLCDCPGLVFPSSVPRQQQVLLGSYPIAQLRVPNAAIKYLGERIDLVRLLQLKWSPAESDHPLPPANWSAVEVCESWANFRGFMTAKAGRPDVSRAANQILRMALEGQITMCLLPTGYTERKDFWQSHKDLKLIEDIQAFGKMLGNDDAVNPAVLAAHALDDDTSDEDEDNHSDGAENNAPKIQNAFALLNTD